MGQLTFQANLGGAVNLIGPNIANTLNLTLPSVDGSAGYPLLTSGAGVLSFGQIALGSAVSGTLPVANGGTGVTTSTGSGSNVLNTSPTLVTPILGTPTSVTLTNATGLPLSTGVTGTLATTNGGTGLTSFTANGVVYASSTSALTTGSALTFDGTNFATSNSMRVTGSTTAYASGAGTEITYISGSNKGGIQVYDRTASAYRDVFLDGANALFQISGSEQMRLTSTGLVINDSARIGSARFSMQVNASTENAIAFKTSTNGEISALRGLNSAGSETVALNYDTTNSALYFRTANTQRMTLDSSGNLGLGVTPSAWASTWRANQLGSTGFVAGRTDAERFYAGSNAYYNGTNWIYITAGKATYYASNLGQHEWYQATTGTAGGTVSWTQAMTLDASGNLLVGTTSSTYSAAGRGVIEVGGGSTAIMALKVGGSGVGYTYHDGTAMSVWNAVNGNLLFGTNNTERARIDSSGNLLVGTTTNASTSGIIHAQSATNSTAVGAYAKGTTSSAVGYYCKVDSSSALYAYWNCNGINTGSISTNGTTTSYNITSDQRLKENIQDADSASELIDAIQVRKYDWKSGGSHQRYGFIAQELVTVAPEAVHQPEDPDEMMGVDYSKLVPMLVKEIQSLRARVAQLESKGA